MNQQVSVPYRGLSFYMKARNPHLDNGRLSFRPLSGSFFLYMKRPTICELFKFVSVPYRGLSFYINECLCSTSYLNEFPSPIGVFLFIYIRIESSGNLPGVSVPYRGLSFYITFIYSSAGINWLFPSPIGVFLFIFVTNLGAYNNGERFRPLSGSFFLYFDVIFRSSQSGCVSVPYRGLSFYIYLWGR